jgi:hypothetical protein
MLRSGERTLPAWRPFDLFHSTALRGNAFTKADLGERGNEDGARRWQLPPPFAPPPPFAGIWIVGGSIPAQRGTAIGRCRRADVVGSGVGGGVGWKRSALPGKWGWGGEVGGGMRGWVSSR